MPVGVLGLWPTVQHRPSRAAPQSRRRPVSRQDNFVSHTMRAEEEANLERINEKKSKSDVTHPLEPLIMSLVKGFVDNQDLSAKLLALYNVRRQARVGGCVQWERAVCTSNQGDARGPLPLCISKRTLQK